MLILALDLGLELLPPEQVGLTSWWVLAQSYTALFIGSQTALCGGDQPGCLKGEYAPWTPVYIALPGANHPTINNKSLQHDKGLVGGEVSSPHPADPVLFPNSSLQNRVVDLEGEIFDLSTEV